MASIAGFVIGSALASDLSDSERMRMGLVGSLMPSPLVGALIVESLVESEEKGSGDKGEGSQALSDARTENDKARVQDEKRGVETMERGGGDKGEGGQALSTARSEDDKARVQDEKREVETMEQQLLVRASRAEARGGFTAQEWESANEDLELLKIQEEKLAADRTKLVESALRAAEPPDSHDDQSAPDSDYDQSY
jgi:hypothetical protein